MRPLLVTQFQYVGNCELELTVKLELIFLSTFFLLWSHTFRIKSQGICHHENQLRIAGYNTGKPLPILPKMKEAKLSWHYKCPPHC